MVEFLSSLDWQLESMFATRALVASLLGAFIGWGSAPGEQE